jgi:thioesterase domain-containing protein
MLVPVQTSGSKPPLFFVHGLRGFTFAVGSRFAAMLGPDQPLYVVNANGLDGRQPIIDYVHEMVVAYLQEIRQARSTGTVRIGGMCAGGMVAIEIARALQSEGRQTGPVILIDPPAIPHSARTRFPLCFGYEIRQNSIDIPPEVFVRFYREMRDNLLWRTSDPDAHDDLPFDPRDPQQLHLATMVGMRTTLAFLRYVPRPFSGSSKVVVSERRASRFVDPQMHWHKLLSGPRVVHVLPRTHGDLLKAGRKTVARLMKSMLEEDPASEVLAEPQISENVRL